MKEITGRRVYYLGRAYDILVDRGIDPLENRELCENIAAYIDSLHALREYRRAVEPC